MIWNNNALGTVEYSHSKINSKKILAMIVATSQLSKEWELAIVYDDDGDG
jgi:hypothetical protein